MEEKGEVKEEPVTLEAFIIKNWQIMTILGVFAGFTNYMGGVNNEALLAMGFLMTFLVELEILHVLLKIKNGSFLLRIFTLLSGIFIIVFGGFLYSKHLAGYVSGFGVAIFPLLEKYRVYILRALFIASALILVLGLYRYLRSISRATLHLVGGDRLQNVKLFFMAVVAVAAIGLVAGFILAPPGAGPAESTITTTTTLECMKPLSIIGDDCCMDFDHNGVCDENEPTTSTTLDEVPEITSTTLAAPQTIACVTNRDCGNETQTRICYLNNVYLQEETHSCQKSGTPESKCVTQVGLVGETLTQKANPLEVCTRSCKDGECT